MSKPIIFNKEEIPLCPNGHGPMYVDGALNNIWDAWEKGIISKQVPEARAHCLICRHTMIIADERPVNEFSTIESDYMNLGTFTG